MKKTRKTRKTDGRAGKPSSFRLDELAVATQLSIRTIRYYIQRGLVAPPEFRGPQTVYSEEHRLRLEAIRALQARNVPLETVARFLDALPAASLPAVIRGDLAPELTLASSPPSGGAASPAVSAERRFVWKLAAGVELHLADDAPGEARSMAEKIIREFSSFTRGDKR